MIVVVSIVDKHKPKGERHVGTYSFEVDYPGDSHFDLMALVCPVENEELARPLLGRLLSQEEIPDAVDGNGNPV